MRFAKLRQLEIGTFALISAIYVLAMYTKFCFCKDVFTLLIPCAESNGSVFKLLIFRQLCIFGRFAIALQP